jgi:hypothetical protein
MIVDPVHAAVDWHFVHLDRSQLLSLLNDGSSPVSQGQNDDPGIGQKTFRTGVAGRPSSRHLVEKMARRRLDAGDYPKTFKEFSEQLAEQLKVEEPEAHPMTPKTIRNSFGSLWPGAQHAQNKKSFQISGDYIGRLKSSICRSLPDGDPA